MNTSKEMFGSRSGQKIAVDGRFLHHPGLGRYTKNLLRWLPNDLDLVVVGNPKHSDEIFCLRPDAEELLIEPEPFTLSEQYVLPVQLLRKGVNLVHSTQFNIPVFWPGPLTVTIHDCAYDRYPEEFSNRGYFAKAYYSAMMKAAVNRADKVISISEATRNDLVRFYGVDDDDVEVIHLGTPPVTIPEQSPERTPSDRFFLHVGTSRPRKNIEGLVRGYAIAAEQEQIPDLVLVGEHDRRFIDIDALTTKLGIKDRVIETGFVNEEYLWWYYANAVALIFPSLYEGFGFPILEAMAVGTPVITSAVPPLSEIADDAALLVDPKSTHAIADALSHISSDQELHRCLASRGRTRSEDFNWSETGNKTGEIYRQLI